MLTLFHHPLCPHSRYVRLILGEYGIAARLVEERFWERREEFLLLNPAGRTAGAGSRGPAADSGRRDHRRIYRGDSSAASGQDRLLPQLARARGSRCAGWRTGSTTNSTPRSAARWSRARVQASYDAGTGRRPARYRCAARRPPQYPLSSGLYRLAGAHARLARRRSAELGRSRRGGASFGCRLFGRSAVERRRSDKELVRARKVAPVVPRDTRPTRSRACRRRKLTPTSTSERSGRDQGCARRAGARARLRRVRRRDSPDAVAES